MMEWCRRVRVDAGYRQRDYRRGTRQHRGTLDATGIDAIDAADIDIASTGIVEAAKGAVLTIDCAGADVEISNHGTLEAKGGELDIVGEAVTNTGTLQAIDGGIVKLTSLEVTNKYGTVSAAKRVDAGYREGDHRRRSRQHRRHAECGRDRRDQCRRHRYCQHRGR